MNTVTDFATQTQEAVKAGEADAVTQGADTGEVIEFGEDHTNDEAVTTFEGQTAGRVRELIESIEEEQAKIDAINEDAKREKAPHADEISFLRKRIRDDYNIEASALGTILTKRRQERRMQTRIDALEADAREQFDQLEMQF